MTPCSSWYRTGNVVEYFVGSASIVYCKFSIDDKKLVTSLLRELNSDLEQVSSIIYQESQLWWHK